MYDGMVHIMYGCPRCILKNQQLAVGQNTLVPLSRKPSELPEGL